MSMQEVTEATRAGLEASRLLGTALVGEVCSRPEGINAFLDPPTLRARVFFEFLGVTEQRARASMDEACLAARSLLESKSALLAGVRPGLSPHAPYTVWPELWTRSDSMCREEGLPWTTHLAESPHEEEFLRQGTGPIRDYLAALGVLDGAFAPLGRSGVELFDSLELLDENALLVHGVHLTEAEIATLGLTDAAVCLCPRSNAYLGLPAPPAQRLFETGVFLCLGTDSVASNEDLSIWAEMRALHAQAPGIPSAAVLQMATANGAMALGFAGEAGVIHAPGPASLVAVSVPDLGDRDPHEVLVTEFVENRVRVLEPSIGRAER
jgi:cytosine/adenosine deaminase-related metal-dependent hydrolase